MTGPLDGVRVLELTRVGPGAFCTMMMADMGADVLKVENPPSAKLAGTGASPSSEQHRRLATSFTNRNKRSITLNLKSDEGRGILHALAREYDVLVEGYRPGVMTRLGADYDTLRALNPRLIYCSLSGYGQSGPYKNYPAHDLNLLAMAGVLSLIGEPGRVPDIPLNVVADYAGASLHGFAGILLALLARERTGRGQFVDISYLDTTIALMAATPNVRDFFADGVEPGRGKGVFCGGYAYYGTYSTSDAKEITIACTEPWLWEKFCDAVGKPELKQYAMQAGDFANAPSAEHGRVREELKALFRSRTRDAWFDLLAEADVCVGKVYDVDEVFEDPQVRHRQMALELEHPEAGPVIQAGVAIKLSDTPGSVRSFAPALGADTQAVLESLGFDATKIALLRQNGAI